MNQQTEILELEVTQEDLDGAIERIDYGGRPSECCVISTAAQRQLENPAITSAFGRVFLNDGSDGVYEEQDELRSYMVAFDAGMYEQLAPRKFVLVRTQ